MEPPIIIRGLEKSFHVRGRRIMALRGIDMTVRTGEVFGLLGPNGSGKSTALRLLMGLAHPDAGECVLFGGPAADRVWLGRVGYLPDTLSFFEHSTGFDHLRMLGRVGGLRGAGLGEAVDRAAELMCIAAYADRPVRTYSKGMRQRLGWAQAILHDPALLILDEPTTGLDPLAKEAFQGLVAEWRAAEKTVLLCTHELDEAERLCDRVSVLHAGRVLMEGTPKAFSGGNGEVFRLSGLGSAAEARLMAWLGEEGIACERMAAGGLRAAILEKLRTARPGGGA